LAELVTIEEAYIRSFNILLQHSTEGFAVKRVQKKCTVTDIFTATSSYQPNINASRNITESFEPLHDYNPLTKARCGSAIENTDFVEEWHAYTTKKTYQVRRERHSGIQCRAGTGKRP